MAEASAGLRLDKFLWFVRLSKTRARAREMAESRHVRIDGRRVERAHALVRTGDVLSFPLGGQVRVIRVERLPARRGDATSARACYTDLAPISANVSQEAAGY